MKWHRLGPVLHTRRHRVRCYRVFAMTAISLVLVILFSVGEVKASGGTVTLYQNDFESPTQTPGRVCAPDFSQTPVNTLYPPGFQQVATPETILINGPANQYSDPQGIGGDYTIGMLRSINNDKLALTFDRQGLQFLNVGLDISAIGAAGCGINGPTYAAIFRLNLRDGSGFGGAVLDSIDVTGTGVPARFTFNWSHHVEALDASGASGNTVTLEWDLIGTSTYAAFDNLIITASDTAGTSDDDDDGVVNLDDLCPDTPAGATVDAKGCAESQMDTDELPQTCGESWHIRSSQLRLGEDGTADDGATFPTILPGGVYAAEVVVTNTSGQPAQLVGWIDFGGDGTFEQMGDRSSPDLVNGTPGGPDGDGVFATGNIPTGVTDQTVSLQWTFEGTPPENTYARIRLTTDPAFFSDNSPQPDGVFGPGETEGHELTGNPLPVTLSYFLATPSGDGLHFVWSTATETGNAGFNLYAETEAGRQRLNAELIPSAVIDSVEPQDYAYEATGVTGEIFYIEQIDVSGHSDLHGPFALGVAHGSRFEPNPTETESHLYLPSVQNR